jgi:hypothetical protein
MEMICPNCQSRCQSTRPLAQGTVVRCPACRQGFAAPGLQTAKTGPSWDPDFEPMPTSKTVATPKSERPIWKDPVVVIGATVPSLILIVFFGYLAWSHVQASPNRDAIITSLGVILLGLVACLPGLFCAVHYWKAPGSDPLLIPPPPTKRFPRGFPAGFRCPFCQSTHPPEVKSRISTAGWVTFILLLIFCFPLCIIGLFIKEDYRVCSSCGIKLG